MKILWITLESLLPANSGGRLGVFKRLEQLSKENDIFLFYPYDNKNELIEVNNLKKYCVEVHPYDRKSNLLNALKLLIKYPYTVGSRCFIEMQADIRKCIDENKIDIINVDFPHMCVNLLNVETDIPIILNEHNIEWKVYRRIAKSEKNIVKKFLYYIDSFRLKKYEKKILKIIPFSSITFVSDKDMLEFNKIYKFSRKNLNLVPVGADMHNLDIVSKSNNEEKNIIFVGKMSYGPNIEGVKWFLKNIFPEIQKQYNQVKFYIVGKDPTEDIIKLSSQNVVVTGIVDDISKYYKIADLVVIPLLNGGGVKVKLLEAISYKDNIVSTSIGVEGTIFSNGKTIPVADSKDDFLKHCIETLKLNQEYISRNKQAYQIFKNNYSWNSIGKEYYKIIKSVVENYEKNK